MASCFGDMLRMFTELSYCRSGPFAQFTGWNLGFLLEIKDIKIPVDYTGHKTNYQKDIALVFLSTPFVYDLRIRPVCLDFDMEFDKKQLIPGNLGIFTGHLNFDEPPFLLVASYIDSGTCAGMASSWHRKYITSDKICGKISFDVGCRSPTDRIRLALISRRRRFADDMNNRLPAGQGLAFPATEGGQRRYYLRGVLSVGLYPPHNSVRDLYVTSKNLLAFTHLLAHKTFIKDSITVEKYRTSIAQIMCRLPSYPKYGSYTVINNPNFSPGDSIDSFYLDYKCDTGYGIVGSNKLFCVNGFQHQQVPKCEKMCFLNRHASVEYLCHDGQLCGKTRKCRIQEPEGITATPVCKTPIYNTSHSLPIMKCSNSTWNYVATCPAVCGTSTPRGDVLVAGGGRARRSEVPWHVGVYDKHSAPYELQCGGSIIARNLVLTGNARH
ncbi:Modular serine protease [Eumeta japonica]|uniref:Modular serine protease n=1 Tax=Eumeta variegata TaxID=151549 RepID=A0A4C1T7U5_EUMVA|nr:Modular serine protease [Eumeta japonica]